MNGEGPLTPGVQQGWIRPEWYLPLDRPPLAWPLVNVETGEVSSQGQVRPGRPLVDLPETAVLPALVNCHTHLDLSLIPAPLGRSGQPFAQWVRLAIEFRREQANSVTDLVDAAIGAGMAESLAAGVELLGDIRGAPWIMPDRQTVDPVVVAFLEQLGTAGSVESARTEGIRKRLAELSLRSPTTLTGLSPHAPYSMDRRLFFRTVATAIHRKVPVAMHLAESPEELELLEHGRGRLWEALGEMGLLAESPDFVSIRECLVALAACERSLVVHGNYLDGADLELIARHRDRMSLVYCPRTHAFFGHREWPMQAALDRGIRVVIGTDSRATSPNLDLLEDLQLVARQFPWLAPREVLRMGTLDGSRALGFDPPSRLVAFHYGSEIGKNPEEAVLARLPNSRQLLGRG